MGRHTTGPTDDEAALDRALRGIATVNDAINTAPLTTQFEILPDTVYGSTQDFDTQSVWYKRNGGDISGRVYGGVDRLIELTTDAGQTDSYASVETSPIVVYRSGTKVYGALGAWLDDLPTGDATFDVEYGREARTLTTEDNTDIPVGTEFYRYRAVEDTGRDPSVGLRFQVGTDVDDDGVAEVNSVDVTGADPGDTASFDTRPKAKFFVVDPLDGTGPSGIQYDPRAGYIYGFLVGWYGPSAVIPFIVETANVFGNYIERIWPIGIYEPKEDPSILRPNQPLKATVDNGTSNASINARVGGRQASYFGNVVPTTEPTQHYVVDQTHDGNTGTVGDVPGSNWQVAAVIKRKANRPGTALGVLSETIATTAGLEVQARTVPESKLSGTLTYTRPTDTEQTNSALLVDCAADTPSRVTIPTETKDNGESVLVGKKIDGDTIGTGKNNLSLGESTGDFAFPLIRTHPTVIIFSVRDRTATPDVDWSFKVAETG